MHPNSTHSLQRLSPEASDAWPKDIRQPRLALFLQTRWLACLALLLVAASVAFVVLAGATPANIKTMALSSEPLFAAVGGDKPTMTLALSVEFPTVGAQYVAAQGANTDATYSNLNEYLGYYDAEACYTYNKAPTEAPTTGFTSSDYKRFDRVGPATSRMCADAFSGNFLNWASNSAIDMLRLALSGGDRYIDTPDLTILQRAVIPNGDPVCMWNSGNFPAKQLNRNGSSSGAYWGAIPLAMKTQAGTNDVWVANTLNQIFFGTSATGTCGSTGAYTLGGGSAAGQTGPVVNPYATGPTGLTSFTGGTLCAAENAACSFSGVREVLYGAIGLSSGWITFPASNGFTCSNNMTGLFIDPGPGIAKACYTRAYTGSWTPVTTGTLNNDGFFYSRVQVCNNSAGVLQDDRDYKLCTQYPNGKFKPTGSIQKYSDQLRLAAFGYLMDQTRSADPIPGRYGGVLRAPMKFVGAKTFTESGQDNTVPGGNPNAEWNVTTGVFNANPDSDTTQAVPISGVINYLNKFGRTGPVVGRYKIYDPVGELYGEALRYLQGLGPTPSAISNTTAVMYDGYPVYTNWTDPFGGTRTSTSDYSCLKSNIVVVGDVNTHDSNLLITRAANGPSNIQDFGAWKNTVTSYEANSPMGYIDGQTISRITGNPNIPNLLPQTTAGAYQVLTGQAYWARTHDIRGSGWTAGIGPVLQRPGLRVKSFFFDVNENGSSNDPTYRQNLNQFFTSAKYGGFEADPSNVGGKPYNIYGNPFKRQDGTNDNNVWQDSLNPKDAASYYRNSSARAVLGAFDSIFSRASSKARSIATTGTSSKQLGPSGASIFQGAFDTSDWSGDVLSIPIIVTATNVVTVGAAGWSAATRLGAMASPASTRNIVVGRSGTSPSPTATSFSWAAIDNTLQVALSKITSASIPDVLGQDRLNYLKGDRSKEGAPFRPRSKLLGDIVNSGTAYSGAPSTAITPNTTAYASFFTANAARTPALFVGANDGMMHSFNANTGDELFGYIPSWMGPKLAALTDASYNNNHQAYVDATPVVAEAQIGSAGIASDWKTVLVGGTGAGGQGVYALDVTNPSAFSAANVLWEFTQLDDASMGYVLGRPQILKLRTSAPLASIATYRWFALVASGVNNHLTPDASGTNYSDGNPALFLLALDKPVGTAWSATGSTPNYYKLTLPVDSTLSVNSAAGVAPGLINFSATFGPVRELAQVYMGDLHGKVWKLDFTQRGAIDWTFDKLSYFKKGSSPALAYPMFIAQTSAGAVQPITSAPTVVSGPVVGGINTAYLSFGTGKFLENADKTSSLQNSFYTIYDNGSASADSSPVGNSAISGRARLQMGTANATTGVVTVGAFKAGRPLTNTDLTQRSGWYFDFPTSGERSVATAGLIGDFVEVSTLIPASAGAAGSCTAAGGSGASYELNVDTGNGVSRISTVGLLGEPLLLDLLGATTYTVSTTTGRRIKTVVSQNIYVGSTGVSAAKTTTTTYVAGRLSWRQINNYLDLHSP